jgi:hypothetical protein
VKRPSVRVFPITPAAIPAHFCSVGAVYDRAYFSEINNEIRAVIDRAYRNAQD